MMDSHNHPEPGRVVNLGLCQMNQQVADSPIQDLVQRQPDLVDAGHIKPAGDGDFLSN
jgi:hypothetical protein